MNPEAVPADPSPLPQGQPETARQVLTRILSEVAENDPLNDMVVPLPQPEGQTPRTDVAWEHAKRRLLNIVVQTSTAQQWSNVALEMLDHARTLERELGEARAAQWRPIETADKERALLLWFPSIGSHPARPWCGRYSFKDKQWVIQTPGTVDGKQIDVSGLPQPTHWQLLPTPPSA